MENVEDKNEKRHLNYLENFLTKGNYNSFRKMLNLNPNKLKRNKNKIFIKNKLKLTKNKTHNYSKTNNIQTLSSNEDLSNYDYEPYFLKRHFDFVDERYRDKSLRGNYESYSMNYSKIKKNLAKRKGISYDNFQIPKIESYKKNIQDKQYYGYVFKNKEIINAITPDDIVQRKYQDFINSFNLNLKKTYIFPKIKTNTTSLRKKM
jgi:hypothetical protein